MENPWEKRKKNPPQKKRNQRGRRTCKKVILLEITTGKLLSRPGRSLQILQRRKINQKRYLRKASSEEKSKEAVGGKEGQKIFLRIPPMRIFRQMYPEMERTGENRETNRRTDGRTTKKAGGSYGEYLKELTEDLPKFIQESEVDETALPELENATVVQVSKEDKEERGRRR
ncbi:MAG: hypothetical protein ACLT4D_15920 [Blautia faecis]